MKKIKEAIRSYFDPLKVIYQLLIGFFKKETGSETESKNNESFASSDNRRIDVNRAAKNRF